MRRVQSANAVFGAMAIALAGAIVIVATPVAASVSGASGASGFSEQKLEKPAAATKIAATQKKKKKKKKTRYPAGKGS